MARSPYLDLSRRERQIMDAIYRLGKAAVADVLAEIPDPPSYSSVRAMMGKLEGKGHLTHRQDGPRYVYSATQPRGEARQTALRRVMRTFFDGSPSKAVAAVLDVADRELSRDRHFKRPHGRKAKVGRGSRADKEGERKALVGSIVNGDVLRRPG